VDGADALTIYAVTQMAADHARRGDGPYLVEAFSYRLGPHTTSDDPTRYRTEEELAPWRAHDPIARAAERLRQRGAWDDSFAAACQAEAEERATSMRQTLIAATPDHPSTVFDLVYANPPQTLLRERDAFVAELATETPQEVQ
jgi:pyruvate dehydrogenase E1 component alpha subunit